jgi:hypothetical protein
MTRHFRFQYRSSFGVRSGKMMMITMTEMIRMVITTIKEVVEAVGILKFSKNLEATSKF